MSRRRADIGLLAGMLLWGASGCQLVEHRLVHGGRERVYYVHEPAGIGGSPTVSRALVVVLHGLGNDGRQAAEMTQMNRKSDEAGFLVAYPDGTGAGLQQSWNAGVCCDPALSDTVDDAGFIDAVISDVDSAYTVDPRQIYLAGFSNGAMMAQVVACRFAERIAAVATVAGTLDIASCNAAEAVSIVAIHGEDDERVDDLGGQFAADFGGRSYPGIREVVDYWKDHDHCSTVATQPIGGVQVERHSGGDNGSEVVLYMIPGGNHSWPGGRRVSLLGQQPSTAISATDLSWAFFEQHPKP